MGLVVPGTAHAQCCLAKASSRFSILAGQELLGQPHCHMGFLPKSTALHGVAVRPCWTVAASQCGGKGTVDGFPSSSGHNAAAAIWFSLIEVINIQGQLHCSETPPNESPSQFIPRQARSWHRTGVRGHLSGLALSQSEFLLAGTGEFLGVIFTH